MMTSYLNVSVEVRVGHGIIQSLQVERLQSTVPLIDLKVCVKLCVGCVSVCVGDVCGGCVWGVCVGGVCGGCVSEGPCVHICVRVVGEAKAFYMWVSMSSLPWKCNLVVTWGTQFTARLNNIMSDN